MDIYKISIKYLQCYTEDVQLVMIRILSFTIIGFSFEKKQQKCVHHVNVQPEQNNMYLYVSSNIKI